MKQTASELVLEHRPVVLPVIVSVVLIGAGIETFSSPASLGPGEWVAAIAGHLVGAFILYLAARRSRMTFDGEKRRVTWRHLGWPGAERGCCALDEVLGIRVAAKPTKRSVKRLELLTAARPVPLTRHYGSFDSRTEAAVRDWLERHASVAPKAGAGEARESGA